MSIMTNWKKNQTSGLFGRMLAKHLNSRKERAQANDTGDSRIQPTKESSSIGVSQIGEAGGKKTAAGFPDEDTRRELADMLDKDLTLVEMKVEPMRGIEGRMRAILALA